MASDFISSADTKAGYGCFQGIDMASKLARRLSKNAIRSFQRYQRVPPLFFLCLQEIGLMDSAIEIPNLGVNLHQAEIILKAAGLWEGLSKDDHVTCGLRKQSGSQQHLWHRIIDQIRYLKHVKMPR
jgi:hypothetical protein